MRHRRPPARGLSGRASSPCVGTLRRDPERPRHGRTSPRFGGVARMATRSLPLASPLVVLGVLLLGLPAPAAPKPDSYWQVDDVRPGMKGQGRTVMKGTKIETFDAEVLGVLKNSSPGRDMVLCRLSGLDLDKTGVIAGMSGSPIYIDGKLLGAVAYAWPYGKEPIAGVTPFCQMHGFVESYERRDLAEEAGPRRVGLRMPVRADGLTFDTVTVAQDCAAPEPAAGDGLWMVPLRTPVAATGFTEHSLRSEERRVGKESRSRRAAAHNKEEIQSSK